MKVWYGHSFISYNVTAVGAILMVMELWDGIIKNKKNHINPSCKTYFPSSGKYDIKEAR